VRFVWIILSLASAFFDSLRNLGSKKVTEQLSPSLTNFAIFFFSLPIYLTIFYAEGMPAIGPNYWWALVFNVVIDFVSFSALTRALSIGDISLVTPLLSFSNVVVLITAPFIVGELTTPAGAMGIVVIVIGAYLLNVGHGSGNFLTPIKALFSRKESQLALFVAVIWGFNAQIAKIALDNSGIGFHLTLVTAIVALLFAIQAWRQGGLQSLHQLPWRRWRYLPLIGFFGGISVTAQFMAYNSAGGLVAYVIAMKRLTLLMGTLYGWWVFHEQNIFYRLLGATIMLAGVILITVMG